MALKATDFIRVECDASALRANKINLAYTTALLNVKMKAPISNEVLQSIPICVKLHEKSAVRRRFRFIRVLNGYLSDKSSFPKILFWSNILLNFRKLKSFQ